MVLAALAFGTLALLSGCALIALAPTRMRWTHLLPAVRTIALVTVAAIYVAALFHGAQP